MFIICYRSVPLSLVVELVIYLNDNLSQHSGLIYTYPDTFINVYFSMRLQLVYTKTIDVCVYRVST